MGTIVDTSKVHNNIVGYIKLRLARSKSVLISSISSEFILLEKQNFQHA